MLTVPVMGETAAFVKHLGDLQEPALRAGKRPGQSGWGEDPPERWGILDDGVRPRAIPSVPGSYQSFYAQMVRALRDGAPVPVDPQDAVTGLDGVLADLTVQFLGGGPEFQHLTEHGKRSTVANVAVARELAGRES